MATDSLDSLKSLHTALIDSRNGYREALDDAGRSGMIDLFRKMIDLRQRHAHQLQTYLVAAGASVDPNGSFMTTVHRVVISFQSLFGDLNERVLPGLIDGEQRIVSAYDDALREPPSDVRDILIQQRASVVAIIADMQQRRAVAA